MRNQNDYDDLMDHVDDLLRSDGADSDDDSYWDGAFDDGFDDVPPDTGTEPVWRNAANGYGADYRPAPQEPDYDEEAEAMRYDPRTNRGSAIPAYNADYASRAASRAKKKKAPAPRRPSAADGGETRQIPADEVQRLWAQEPQPRRPARPRPQPVYTPDYDAEEPYEDEPPAPRRRRPQEEPRMKTKRKRKKKHRFLKFILVLLVLLALAVGALWLFAKEPDSANSLGAARDGATAILLAGTDKDGTRTDTMMLLYLDAKQGKMNLLSLPRDTYTSVDSYVPKLNSIYGLAGGGKEGMEALLDYTAQCIGYRPDGYILIDLDCFESLVNLMGGVRFNVPQDMQYEDPSQDLYIDLKAGEQKLNGQESMWLVRYRSGYALADLQRVQVQRDFLQAALSQWLSLKNIWKAPAAAGLVTANTTTNLSVRELAWIAKTAKLIGTENMQTDTLPGEADYVGDGSYYILWPEATAELINASYNPYDEDVSSSSIYSPYY